MARTAKTNIRIKNAGLLLGEGFDTIDLNTGLIGSDEGLGVVGFTSTGGSSGTQVTGEVVDGSGTTFTLLHSPTLGSERIYANGQRLTGGGVDYTISGAVITTINSWLTGQVLADYTY